MIFTIDSRRHQWNKWKIQKKNCQINSNTISRKMFHKLMILSRYFVLILNCPIFLLILVNWGDFFSVGDTKFMAVMLKGPWIWNKRWNIQICVQKLAKEGQNFYVQAINYQLPLDFQFSDIENTENGKETKTNIFCFWHYLWCWWNT